MKKRMGAGERSRGLIPTMHASIGIQGCPLCSSSGLSKALEGSCFILVAHSLNFPASPPLSKPSSHLMSPPVLSEAGWSPGRPDVTLINEPYHSTKI